MAAKKFYFSSFSIFSRLVGPDADLVAVDFWIKGYAFPKWDWTLFFLQSRQILFIVSVLIDI